MFPLKVFILTKVTTAHTRQLKGSPSKFVCMYTYIYRAEYICIYAHIVCAYSKYQHQRIFMVYTHVSTHTSAHQTRWENKELSNTCSATFNTFQSTYGNAVHMYTRKDAYTLTHTHPYMYANRSIIVNAFIRFVVLIQCDYERGTNRCDACVIHTNSHFFFLSTMLNRSTLFHAKQ